MSDLTVRLGTHEYTFEPQPYGLLRHELRSVLSSIGGGLDSDSGDIMGMIGGNAYRLLSMLIPGLMPQYEFEGYSSQERYDEDRESGYLQGPDAARLSPTNDEILSAIELGAKINRLDLVKHLRGVVGADFFKVYMQKAMIDTLNSPSTEPSSLPGSTGTGSASSTIDAPSTDDTAGSSPESGDSSETEALTPAA